MQFSVITLFPDLVEQIKQFGVVGRAFQKESLKLTCINPRNFTTDNYQTIDDKAYGGGPGMVMLAEPLYQAVQQAKAEFPKARVIYLSPQGKPLKQAKLTELASLDSVILLSGRYEGIDQRLIDSCVDEEISVGDYVLSGGELPAMLLIDGVARLCPGVLGHEDSAKQDSFTNELLDYPHYTRPQVWRDIAVPEVLVSGDHAAIAKWRDQIAKETTKAKRPDLLVKKP